MAATPCAGCVVDGARASAKMRRVNMSDRRQNPTAVLPAKCEACDRPLENPIFCTGCHTLRPANRLNYFELLSLPPRYELDPASLRKAYLELSRGVHPDRFPGAASDVASLSLQWSAQANRAYQVLLDPVLRAEYLLELADGPSAVADKSVPAEVLAKTLELREEIDEARAAGDVRPTAG
jgi:molecular chaperone HscB